MYIHIFNTLHVNMYTVYNFVFREFYPKTCNKFMQIIFSRNINERWILFDLPIYAILFCFGYSREHTGKLVHAEKNRIYSYTFTLVFIWRKILQSTLLFIGSETWKSWGIWKHTFHQWTYFCFYHYCPCHSPPNNM